MINVNIWKFRGSMTAWGHASLQLGCSTYISWWPERETVTNQKGLLFEAHPIKRRLFVNDLEAEGYFPDELVYLTGLNEDAIKKWWASFGLMLDGREIPGPLRPYRTLRQNCSTVVAEALIVGGGRKYAPWAVSRKMVWTPNDVLLFARAIEKELRWRK